MPRKIPCPGRHNDPWRIAESDNPGQDHEGVPAPVYGDVRWCDGCTARVRRQLLELPRLYAQLHIELTEATKPQNLHTGGRGGGNSEPMLYPGERYMRLADDIHDRVVDWAITVREQRRLAQPASSVRPGHDVARSIMLLADHLPWLLDEHDDPDAGRAFVDDVHQVHTAATRATGDAPVRPEQRDETQCPNPKCRLAALETEVVDGTFTGYIVCRECGQLSTEAELADSITGSEQVRRPARARAYQDAADVLADPLARPLTMAQVMARIGRSRRTIQAWVAAGLLTPYLVHEEKRTVKVYLEREVLELHAEKNQAAAATRLNLRNQRAKADAAQPPHTPTPEAISAMYDAHLAAEQAWMHGTPVDAPPMLDVEEPTDIPPNTKAALQARMRPSPRVSGGTITLKVKGELDTSSMVDSLRRSAAVMTEAADKLEAIDGTPLGSW